MILCLLLAGCGAPLVHVARTRLVGMSEADLTACAGPPAKAVKIDGGEVLDYAFSTPGGGPAISLDGLLTLPLLAAGGCHAEFRMGPDGRVRAVHFSGTTPSWTGANAACAPIVRDCVEHPD